MPVLDGIQATRQIREQLSSSQLPIIALTAHASREERNCCRDAGMNDHLIKPLQPDQHSACLLSWVRPPVISEKAPVRPHLHHPLHGVLPNNLSGLDLELGVRLVGGNVELYRRLIIAFARDNQEVVRHIRGALAEKDLHKAGIMAHTLQGVAGNLAATALHAAARDLETASVRGEAEQAGQLIPRLTAGTPSGELYRSGELSNSVQCRCAAIVTPLVLPLTQGEGRLE